MIIVATTITKINNASNTINKSKNLKITIIDYLASFLFIRN